MCQKKLYKGAKKVDKNKTEEISIELNEVVFYQIGSSLDATTL
jgi:hypothetical protein